MEKQLPKNWVECTLSDVFEIVTGNTPSKSYPEYYGEDIPWVKPGDINRSVEIYETEEYLSKLGFDKSRKIPKGSVMVTCIGNLGNIAIAGTELATNQQINTIVISHNLINKKYVYYRALTFKKWLVENSTSTTIAMVNKSNFEKLPFLLPPLPEQARIVAKLDKLFAQLETIKSSMVNIPAMLKDFRQQVLTQAVTGKLLNVNQFTELGNLEIEIKTGPFGSSLHKSDYTENGIPVINPSHIQNGTIIPDVNVAISKEKFNNLKAYKLLENDVILGRRGEMGRAALYNESYGLCLCGTGSIILRCGNNLYPKFLTYYLRSPFCVEYLNANSVGSTMINLNQKIIKSLRVPNVSYSEQKEIVYKIESLFAKADTIEKQYKSLKDKIDTLPQALLHKAFKGELTEQLKSDGDARELLRQIQELKTPTKVVKNEKLEKLKSFNKKIKNYPKSEGVLGMVAEGK